MQNTDLQIDKLARRRAKAKLGFFFHACVYVAVNLGLIALSLYHGRAWAIFPLLGWGVGLLFHGLSVWVFAPGNDLMESMVRRERAKLSANTRGEPW
ncbi:2TM domain-containing protein [Acidovorax soli]|uniref:2TM domain-containing protein n=1 Tax=Acidovorax soli TaxID=592050 RepID=A0A1H4FAQ5_9BURK|nr:2TM domain-containing protein [Acidovorax soli]MBU2049268.1 2TM domain-containing protein [Gammaproteobacteria bacterium]SEA94406.1 2TM domain-containing protein [Acidovorax soli]